MIILFPDVQFVDSSDLLVWGQKIGFLANKTSYHNDSTRNQAGCTRKVPTGLVAQLLGKVEMLGKSKELDRSLRIDFRRNIFPVTRHPITDHNNDLVSYSESNITNKEKITRSEPI